MQNTKLQRMTAAALLTAVGILIPLLSPLKLYLEPASYTLASHVAIFVSMFISPAVAAAVTVGTTLGFFLAGSPIVVVLRAASHIVFVLIGAFWLQKWPAIAQKPGGLLTFAVAINLVHAAAEVGVVAAFYFSGSMQGYYALGFVQAVLGLVGLGGLAHALVDFAIALVVLYPLCAQRPFRHLFPYSLPRRGATAQG